MTQTKQRPAHTVREGRVEVAVWRRDGTSGSSYSVSMSRSYKKDDQWKHSGSFFEDDLLTLIDGLHEARRWIREQNRIEGRGGNVATAEETVA